MNLTKKQRDVLDFLIDYKRANRIAPTLAEIAANFGITKETAHSHLRQLERKAAVRRNKHEARGITILAEDFKESSQPRMPLLGYISAGMPIEALLDQEEFDLDRVLPPRRDCFVLRVRGDSMIDEGIQDGDYVIIQRKSVPENGDTVVALVNQNEATLKKYFLENKKTVRLQPANPNLKPFYPKEVKIQGVVVGVVRRY
ncbi:MAG: repressor LexA [Planctomycetes bacterium]|nr:repressor LexA [Planctomycetota bacterium]